jgi:transposase
MEISPVATASAAEQGGTIYVALELSKSRWLVGIHTPLADKVSRYSVPGGDSAALLDRIGRARQRAEQRLERPVRIACCYEAGYDGFWLHRLLRAAGIENQVMDPASLPVNRRARRAKTDRIDLAALLRALMAWDRGEQQVCRMVRVPSPEQVGPSPALARARTSGQGAGPAHRPHQRPADDPGHPGFPAGAARLGGSARAAAHR